jgi:Phage integrase, N-terminal/Integrase
LIALIILFYQQVSLFPGFCCVLFSIVIFFLLLSASFCFFLLLSASFCFFLLLSASFCFFLLLYFFLGGIFMHDLNFQLRNLCLNSKEDSFATRSDRLSILLLLANQLHSLGFRRLSLNGLKPKHVFALVDLWKKQSISVGSIKNRLASIRWWARKIGKFDMLSPSNDVFAIQDRHYVTNVSKSSHFSSPSIDFTPSSFTANSSYSNDLSSFDSSFDSNDLSSLDSSFDSNDLSSLDSSFLSRLDKISDINIKTSILLQAAFGLRREECLKFVPSCADRGHSIVLKGSWCKGGQQRSVPIFDRLIPFINLSQRQVLDKARLVAGFASMIPNHRSYIQQLKAYENLTHKVGLFKLHALRHKYAQERYFHITAWLSPSDGGISKDSVLRSDSLSDVQKHSWIKLDYDARLIISNELGHHRESITAVYLGR